MGRGRVEVLHVDRAGQERVARTLGPGAVLGDVSFLRGIPRQSTARAASSVVLFALPRAAYEAVLKPQPAQPGATPALATAKHP